MFKPLIIANWKSNPDTMRKAVILVRKIESGIGAIKNAEVIIAPPFPYLGAVKTELKKARLGAQNTFWKDIGPYTGEVSWHQLKNLGARYIIVGHSERKFFLGETDDIINKKVCALLQNGLKPILCLGERERTGNEIPALVGDQLKNALKGTEKNIIPNLVVCYEPVWAISTEVGSRPDTPDSAFRAMLYIRKILTDLYGRKIASMVRVIYGGSVNAQNIIPFLKEGKMQGALVGGASLDPKEFVEIIRNSVV